MQYNCEIGGGDTKKSHKIRKVKDYSYRERFETLELINLLERRVKGVLIETLKIINGISNYGRHYFNMIPWTGEFTVKTDLKKLRLLIDCIFMLIELYILGTNCLIRSKAVIVQKILIFQQKW